MKNLLVAFLALSLTACSGRVSSGEATGIAVADKIGRMRGSACRKMDGSWEIAGPA